MYDQELGELLICLSYNNKIIRVSPLTGIPSTLNLNSLKN